MTGLTCGHCTGSVTAAVSALPQVTDVHVELVAGGVSTLTVTGAVPPETVRQAVGDAGYTIIDS
ncbi:hypothetical protein A605_14537 (plasmid) [Corynebacterium halotolerans YIM 70093 = DSM 44683]|uniref:HMA domain-containing protein n=1 Tax=Corynebacterium halotolerans YIM 70093 = DSM 44683 TaxID=1121362 RepID=M1NWL4_9CORY|nr:hypothetical protein A605_14537 [Corynebacterium halotolerans YIM 70093 = DSM 44683]